MRGPRRHFRGRLVLRLIERGHRLRAAVGRMPLRKGSAFTHASIVTLASASTGAGRPGSHPV